MTYFFNTLPFPSETRMTSLWSDPWVDEPLGGHIAVGHLIRLLDGQDVDVESDFLTSHMPFHIGGFGGVYPDGTPWLFVLQHGPPSESTMVVGDVDPFWAMRDSLHQALTFSPGAEMTLELRWTRDDLVRAYEDGAVKRESLDGWPVAALLRGLLAECCYVPLTDIVDGYATGCAFPGIEHSCEADVFTDVFARWSAQLIPGPASARGEEDEYEEFLGRIDRTSAVHSTRELMTLTGTATLEDLAELLELWTELDFDLSFDLSDEEPEITFVAVIANRGVGLDFPFTLDELLQQIREMERDLCAELSDDDDDDDELEESPRPPLGGLGEGAAEHARSSHRTPTLDRSTRPGARTSSTLNESSGTWSTRPRTRSSSLGCMTSSRTPSSASTTSARSSDPGSRVPSMR